MQRSIRILMIFSLLALGGCADWASRPTISSPLARHRWSGEIQMHFGKEKGRIPAGLARQQAVRQHVSRQLARVGVHGARIHCRGVLIVSASGRGSALVSVVMPVGMSPLQRRRAIVQLRRLAPRAADDHTSCAQPSAGGCHPAAPDLARQQSVLNI